MKLHIFFSVHERLFGPVAEILRREHGLAAVSGFVWGEDQRRYLDEQGIRVDPLTVFSRDLYAAVDDQPADLAYLAAWEARAGIPLQHMVFSDRHLHDRLPYDRVLRLAELTFRRAEHDFDTIRPDAYFSEDVACLTSYIHWAVAKDRGVRIVFINNARFPKRITAYGNPYQQWDLLDQIFPDTPPGLLSEQDLADADRFIGAFRDRPRPPTGLQFRAKLRLGNRFDLDRLRMVRERWKQDPDNPTLRSPAYAMVERGKRLVRDRIATARGMFDRPVDGEKFVLFPLHLQPEATTLVLAPYYLDQLALVQDMAKSLPAGHWLYVKDHVICRGRWPLHFYEGIRKTPGVRLLSSAEDPYELSRRASAIAVITGTLGWEGILLDKPVITFGHVFYNRYPLVHRAGELPKGEWPALFRKAIFDYRGDPKLLRRFVACAWKSTFDGLTGNPTSLPAILEPDNVRQVAKVVGEQIGLIQPPRARQASSS